MPEGKPAVIAIVGPTASGKTALSLEIAKRFSGEIIACDSRTVYKHFDIGTAKPSAQERACVPHFAVDVAEPEENYTAARFAAEGAAAIADITARGKTAMLVGGTGFYARALLEGLAIPPVPPQEQLRARLQAIAEERGNEALYRILAQVDPQTAQRLNPNDRFRIIRALEVYEVTGVPFSRAATVNESAYRTIWIGLTAQDRGFLHRQIEKRFHEQLALGLLEETKHLYERFGASQKLMHTVNYKQLVKMIEGEIDRDTAYRLAVQHNIQLSRKQLIWFRANPQISWFAIDKASFAALSEQISLHIEEELRK